MGCVKSKQKILTTLKEGEDEWKAKVLPTSSHRRGNTVVEFDGDYGNMTVSVMMSDRNGIESVYDGVYDGKVLGYGIGGLVRCVTHKKTETNYALKTLSLNHISEEGLQQVQAEVGILMDLDHPNIVKLDGVYQTIDEIYLVQEMCGGGDLFDRLDAQPEEHYSEAQCARLIKQILSAVRYIHSKGIIHRDLKLENFLFDNNGPNAELKMIDFGLSKHFNVGDTHHEPVGTRYTVAPEVLQGSYSEKVDIWAVGVLTYLLLSGDAPFGGCGEGDSNADVRKRILEADFSFEPQEYWSHVSQQAKDFISSLLITDPDRRPTAEQCQKNKWLREWAEKETSGSLNPKILEALRSFRQFSDMRKLLCEVIGFTLLPEQVAILRNDFEKFDVEQSGEISLDGLKKILLDNVGSGNIENFIESEVEEIFNALRMHDSDTTVHWHHFLAAGLSELPVDERNQMLAFDKIDKERKGYITFDNIMDICPEKFKKREELLKYQWNHSAKLSRSRGSRIHYKDFVRMVENMEENN
jgi:calcium-dependent protein kinase